MLDICWRQWKCVYIIYVIMHTFIPQIDVANYGIVIAKYVKKSNINI